MKVLIKCKGADVADIDSLLGLQGNLKTLTEEDEEKLRGNITRDGFIAPIFVWTSTRNGKHYILDGHQRLLVLKKLKKQGWEVPPLPVDFIYAETRKEAERLLLQIVSQFGRVTKGGLEEFIERAGIDIATLKFEVSIPGMELKFAVEGTSDDDVVPPEPKAGLVSDGDVWLLGEHRIVCGDARKARAWRKVPPGSRACVTDLPEGGWKAIPLLAKSCADQAVLYAFYHEDDNLLHLLMDATDGGFLPEQEVVWVRDTFVVSRQDYDFRHEPVIVGRKPGRDHEKAVYAKKGKGGRVRGKRQDTVWEFPVPLASKKFPTLKPVELIVRAYQNSSSEGDQVVDPFAGTGTCLIAAEKTGRRCVAMEADPKMVWLAVTRFKTWCKANGIPMVPVKEGS